MPIEGPIRELALPDVFQLLELSRKTGVLRVRSQLRNDEGEVYFEAGRVVQASLRSKPAPAKVADSSMTEREVERKMRGHIETAVFELMSWREGFFSFEERGIPDLAEDKRVRIATESLLMESARRVDEWSRIADKVPHAEVVPLLADVTGEHESQLDLLPHEWEVLSLIDGQRDVKGIAAALHRSEFDTAKVVYGLVTTGVVEIKPTRRVSASIPAPKPFVDPEIRASLNNGFAALRTGDFVGARKSWERFLSLAPHDPAARRVRSALDAVNSLIGAIDAHDHA
jgi:hypothetical protein